MGEIIQAKFLEVPLLQAIFVIITRQNRKKESTKNKKPLAIKVTLGFCGCGMRMLVI